MIFRRPQVAAPRVITIESLGYYTENELQFACRVAVVLGSVLYLAAPHRP